VTGSPGDAAEARPDEIAFTLVWEADGGQLTGRLEARNIGDRPVRLSHKPVLVPIGADGEPLDAHTVVTMEFRPPGYVELEPGERAGAGVSWGGWDGPPASGRFVVEWAGGRSEVEALGPWQPTSTGPATNLSSSWWDLLG
jgi:hypothetical protein